MRLLLLPAFLLFAAFFTSEIQAQATLLEEDFNNCALPANWQVNLTGNQNAQWYVDLSQNTSALGESIDSTCFLFIDDNTTGNNTAGYVLEFVSPVFDASQHETVELSLDVHYRHKNGTQQFMDILITDGNTEQLLTRFDAAHTNGGDITEHFALRYDLALLTQSANTQLIIRYDDSNGDWGWWAGIDNVKVLGTGSGTNVLAEAFNSCSKPLDWETEILGGQDNWQFGLVPSSSAAASNGNSMDGSCFIYFDDDALGGGAPPSSIRLVSPWFNGVDFFTYEFSYDLMLRFNGESIAVYIEDDLGGKTELFRSASHVGGPWFPDYIHQTHDLTKFRSQQLRVVFEYTDGGVFGYWVGLDNIKVTGRGSAFDFCNQAHVLQTGANCTLEDNETALFNGPAVSCTNRAAGTLWYQWEADFTGIAEIKTNATFNDITNIYTGSCTNLQAVLCNNRDEHGFTGEESYFQVQAGTTYLIRVSGQEDGFGIPRGELCVELNQVNAFPTQPSNDDCASAEALTVDGSCLSGNNYNADMTINQPSLNDLARADVWYSFVAPTLAPGDILEVQSNATFSDIITVYEGTCNSLTEIAGNHKGGSLELPTLTNGATYFIQIAGNFASIEGSLCPRVVTKQGSTLSNDNCVSAIEVPLGGQCISGNNDGASFSGYQPICAVFVDRDIWFKFTAPSFGSVQINTGASFEHTLAVWEGDCNDLSQVFCTLNPLRCDGFVSVPSLVPGKTYYVQIASWIGAAGISSGSICLKILSGQDSPDFKAMELELLQPCVGIDSAQLKINITGGISPYTFLADTDDQIVSSGEPIFIIVKDAMGCEVQLTDTAQACASNACDATATINVEHASCFGNTDGSVQADVAGAGGVLEFQWSNNVFTSTNSNLAAGTYTVTVTEPSGCEYIFTETVVQPDEIQVLTDSVKQPIIGQSTGSIHINVSGGNGVFNYSWSRNDSLLTSNLEDLDNIPAGLYTLVVTDSAGCEGTYMYNLLAVGCNADVSLSVDPPTCFGDTDGSIIANVSGSPGTLQYVWSNSVTTASNTGLTAGDYTVTITEQPSGCEYVYTESVVEPDEIQVLTDNIQQPFIGESNGLIQITVSGGNGGYSYSWFRNDTLLQNTMEDLDNIPAGLYTLQVVDSAGCEGEYAYDLIGIVSTQKPIPAIQVALYPNPAQEIATLSLSLANPQKVSVMLIDAYGRVLSNRRFSPISQQLIEFDLKHLAAGVYMVRVQAGQQGISNRLVVVR